MKYDLTLIAVRNGADVGRADLNEGEESWRFTTLVTMIKEEKLAGGRIDRGPDPDDNWGQVDYHVPTGTLRAWLLRCAEEDRPALQEAHDLYAQHEAFDGVAWRVEARF